MTIDAPGFAAHQFGHVGVFLLRHDGTASGEAVGKVNEAYARTHPQNQLFGKARQVRHQQRGGGAKFDGEVAVADGIERVGAHALKAQFGGDAFAVDGKRGARQRRSAQRQAVGAAAAVGKAFGIAREHLKVRHEVMTEGDRLRDLQVRKAGHRRVDMLFGQIQQRALQFGNEGGDGVDGVALPQADVGGDLVVAAAPGVQAFASVAHQRGEAPFDVQMHVFRIQRPDKGSGGDFVADLRHAAFDGGEVFGRQNALSGEHVGVRKRALNILRGQTAVKIDRGGIAFHQIGDRLGKAARPGEGGVRSSHGNTRKERVRGTNPQNTARRCGRGAPARQAKWAASPASAAPAR